MKNHQTNVLIDKLKKAKQVKLWARLARELSAPTRNTRRINVSKLARYADKDMTLVVPGKVLGAGELGASLKVASFSISEQAAQKIKDAKGTYMTIEELMQKNPKAEKVRIIG